MTTGLILSGVVGFPTEFDNEGETGFPTEFYNEGETFQALVSDLERGYETTPDSNPEPSDDRDYANVEVYYQNDWDEDLLVECHNGYGIFKFQSIHNNRREDRRWRFDCSKIKVKCESH